MQCDRARNERWDDLRFARIWEIMISLPQQLVAIWVFGTAGSLVLSCWKSGDVFPFHDQLKLRPIRLESKYLILKGCLGRCNSVPGTCKCKDFLRKLRLR